MIAAGIRDSGVLYLTDPLYAGVDVGRFLK